MARTRRLRLRPMFDPASQVELKRAIAECIVSDQGILQELREEIRPLRQQTKRIQPRATTSISLVGTDGGVTLERVDGSWVGSDGGMPQRIKNQLVDAGLYPNAPPDAIVYHELPPPTTADDNVVATMTVKSLDVYFMNYSAGDATPAHRALWYDLDSPNSVIEQVRRAVKDSWFGIGRYEQYDHSAWRADWYHTVVYDHVQSMTPDLAKVTDGTPKVKAFQVANSTFHEIAIGVAANQSPNTSPTAGVGG